MRQTKLELTKPRGGEGIVVRSDSQNWQVKEYYGCFAAPASASRDARGNGNPSPSNCLLGHAASSLNETVRQFRAYAFSTSLSVSRLSAGDVSNGTPDARQFKKCSIAPR